MEKDNLELIIDDIKSEIKNTMYWDEYSFGYIDGLKKALEIIRKDAGLTKSYQLSSKQFQVLKEETIDEKEGIKLWTVRINQD